MGTGFPVPYLLVSCLFCYRINNFIFWSVYRKQCKIWSYVRDRTLRILSSRKQSSHSCLVLKNPIKKLPRKSVPEERQKESHNTIFSRVVPSFSRTLAKRLRKPVWGHQQLWWENWWNPLRYQSYLEDIKTCRTRFEELWREGSSGRVLSSVRYTNQDPS